jgi:hypothetical protein
MAPVFVAGASRVFATGSLSLHKIRTDGSDGARTRDLLQDEQVFLPTDSVNFWDGLAT